MSDRTYEMLWDCKYCGQRKNLGLTHRHCPSCGAPQDPAGRYFPPDSEKVAVQDHPYVGADVRCPVCSNAMARSAKCCGNCGSPLTGGKDVQLVQAPVAPQQGPPMSAAPKKGFNWLFVVLPILGVLGLCCVSGVVVSTCGKREGSFVVESTSWERSIAIEKNEMKRDSAWCDSVPSDGRVLGRHQEQRSSKQVPDGQTCTTKKQDLGNGTYKEVDECKPKFKSEPVYDQKCDYEAPRWVTQRTEKKSGAASPVWPEVVIDKKGTCVGCEREGARAEKYTVTFSSDGKTSSCDFPESRWSAFKVGASYQGKSGLMGLDCDSLK